ELCSPSLHDALPIWQRVFGLALGYEDLNDHHALRHDIALQTAVDTDGVLASQSTLCRFEQQADRDWAITIHEEMIEQFIRSFRRSEEHTSEFQSREK